MIRSLSLDLKAENENEYENENDFSESALAAQPAQVNNSDTQTEDGAGDDIKRHMLADRDGGIHDAQAPQPVESARETARTQLTQQALAPDSSEHGEGHMQGRTGVARSIGRFKKGEFGVL